MSFKQVTSWMCLTIVVVSTLFPSLGMSAENRRDRVDFSLILDAEVAVETHDGDLQKWEIVATPELDFDFGRIGKLTAVARLRADLADELEPGQPRNQDAVRGPASRREFILPDFEDRRIPLWTANIEIPLGPLYAQLLWIPDHTYNEIPDSGATYRITSPRLVPELVPASVPESPPGSAGPIFLEEPDRPDTLIEDDDYGVRLSGFVEGWDFSVNYMYHYQDRPVLFRQPAPGGGVRVDTQYERTHLIGGSFSNAFRDVTLRGESGYSTDLFVLTTDESDRNGVFSSGEFSSVVGLDYQYDADLFISGQLFTSLLATHRDGAVRDRVENQVTLLIQKQLYNDTLTLEALAIHSVNDGDGVLQAEAAYKFRENMIFTLGADFFYGSRHGVFGQFEDVDRLTLGVELGL